MKETVIIYLAHAPCEDSHTLLRRAASRLTGLPEEEFITEKAPLGKPFFPRCRSLHFSVSHSGDLWLCAFASLRIGCDVQLHTEPRRPDAIAERYFHPNEQEVYRNAEDKLTVFHRIWCRKEAAVKRTGHGIDRTFALTDTTVPDCGVYDIDLPFPGYSCAVACEIPVNTEIRLL